MMYFANEPYVVAFVVHIHVVFPNGKPLLLHGRLRRVTFDFGRAPYIRRCLNQCGADLT